MYKYLSKKYMKNWIRNNQKTCTSEGFDVDEEENGDGEEHNDADYNNDDSRTSGSFGNICMATATSTTTKI